SPSRRSPCSRTSGAARGEGRATQGDAPAGSQSRTPRSPWEQPARPVPATQGRCAGGGRAVVLREARRSRGSDVVPRASDCRLENGVRTRLVAIVAGAIALVLAVVALSRYRGNAPPSTVGGEGAPGTKNEAANAGTSTTEATAGELRRDGVVAGRVTAE